MLRAFHHIAISTPDIERLAAFYCTHFGFEILWRAQHAPGERPLADAMMDLHETGYKVAMMRAAGAIVELFEFQSPLPTPRSVQRAVHEYGYSHICLQVTDLETEYARLKAAGVVFHCPPRRTAGHAGTYGRDPDGNVFELLEFFEDRSPLSLLHQKQHLQPGKAARA